MFDAPENLMDTITVEEAGAGDRECVLDFYIQLVEAHGVHRSRVEAKQHLDRILSAPYRVHLLRQGDRIIGSAVWMEMGDHVFLRHFTIDASLRGQGLGAQAYAALEAACFSGREVELVARGESATASAFWLAQEFKPVGSALIRDAREAP